MDLTNKTALVTGGGSGIGLAISELFAACGAKVIITGRNKQKLETAITEVGPNCTYRVCDHAYPDKSIALIKELEKESVNIDILVNNAGIHLKKVMEEVTDQEFDEILQTNLKGVYTLTREVASRMKKRESGNIIMISSMASRYGIPKVIAYTAAKSAIEGMTRAMAVELGAFNIRVNCIAPGFIYSYMSAGALNSDPERKQKVLGRTPLGRMGDTEDVAQAACFLASDAARYITGVVLPVDGGNSIGF